MSGFVSTFLLITLFLSQGRMLQPADVSTFLAIVAKLKQDYVHRSLQHWWHLRIPETHTHFPKRGHICLTLGF